MDFQDFTEDQLQDAVMNCTDFQITTCDDSDHISYLINGEEFSDMEELYDYIITNDDIRKFLENEAA